MDIGPESHWFDGPKERFFTPLEIASMEFGDALVESIVKNQPIDPSFMDSLATAAAKEAERDRQMEVFNNRTNDEALEELKRELLLDFASRREAKV